MFLVSGGGSSSASRMVQPFFVRVNEIVVFEVLLFFHLKNWGIRRLCSGCWCSIGLQHESKPLWLPCLERKAKNRCSKRVLHYQVKKPFKPMGVIMDLLGKSF